MRSNIYISWIKFSIILWLFQTQSETLSSMADETSSPRCKNEIPEVGFLRRNNSEILSSQVGIRLCEMFKFTYNWYMIYLWVFLMSKLSLWCNVDAEVSISKVVSFIFRNWNAIGLGNVVDQSGHLTEFKLRPNIFLPQYYPSKPFYYPKFAIHNFTISNYKLLL